MFNEDRLEARVLLELDGLGQDLNHVALEWCFLETCHYGFSLSSDACVAAAEVLHKCLEKGHHIMIHKTHHNVQRPREQLQRLHLDLPIRVTENLADGVGKLLEFRVPSENCFILK